MMLTDGGGGDGVNMMLIYGGGKVWCSGQTQYNFRGSRV